MGVKLFYVLAVCAASAIAGTSADVVNPCKTEDLACIGKYLAKHSKCKADNVGPADFDSFSVPFKRIYLPGFNVSEDRYDTTYTGLGTGVVDSFVENKETGKVVLTLQFPTLVYKSDARKVYFYLPGKEPFSVKTKAYTTTLKDLSFTIIFESTKDLELSDADIYPFITTLPTFIAEDDALEKAAKKNPQVAAVLQRYEKFRGIPILESQYLRAPEIITEFVNNRICKYERAATVPDRRCNNKICGGR